MDHNRQTGKVHERLSHLCNAVIGCARENIASLASAIPYLRGERQSEPEGIPAIRMPSLRHKIPAIQRVGRASILFPYFD